MTAHLMCWAWPLPRPDVEFHTDGDDVWSVDAEIAVTHATELGTAAGELILAKEDRIKVHVLPQQHGPIAKTREAIAFVADVLLNRDADLGPQRTGSRQS
ncbi:hypothetical protein ACFVAV_35375 [Nocardia sp. NPDC057663]|uniref:hypothetical protein n=1 Tax=Nocardia sp. NPDC057663 TaxID=3346201 RepID=UPI00366D6A03